MDGSQFRAARSGGRPPEQIKVMLIAAVPALRAALNRRSASPHQLCSMRISTRCRSDPIDNRLDKLGNALDCQDFIEQRIERRHELTDQSRKHFPLLW
jgi:hypothetical protein